MSEPAVPLRRNRDFTMLWVGESLSELGTSMSTLAFPLVGYAVTGSTTQAGVATTAVLVGSVAAQLPAGALVDRWSRRAALVYANAVSALAYGLLATTVLLDSAGLAVLVLGGLLAGVASAFLGPAGSAAVRTIVPPDDLPLAYTRLQARYHAANLIGPPLAGALYAVARGLPFVVDAVSFVVFAALVTRIRTPLPRPLREGAARSVRADIADGLRFLWSRPAARAMMLWGGLLNLAVSFVFVSLTLRLIRVGVHPAAIGAIDAIAAASGLAGAFVAGPTVRRWRTGRTTVLTGVLVALCVVPMAWTNNVVVIGAFLALGTFLLPANNAGIGAYLSTVTPDEMQGRLNAAAGFVANGAVPVAPVLAGVALAAVGGTTTTLIGAALVATSIVPLLATPEIRRLGRPAEWSAAAAS